MSDTRYALTWQTFDVTPPQSGLDSFGTRDDLDSFVALLNQMFGANVVFSSFAVQPINARVTS